MKPSLTSIPAQGKPQVALRRNLRLIEKS